MNQSPKTYYGHTHNDLMERVLRHEGFHVSGRIDFDYTRDEGQQWSYSPEPTPPVYDPLKENDRWFNISEGDRSDQWARELQSILDQAQDSDGYKRSIYLEWLSKRAAELSEELS